MSLSKSLTFWVFEFFLWVIIGPVMVLHAENVNYVIFLGSLGLHQEYLSVFHIN